MTRASQRPTLLPDVVQADDTALKHWQEVARAARLRMLTDQGLTMRELREQKRILRVANAALTRIARTGQGPRELSIAAAAEELGVDLLEDA